MELDGYAFPRFSAQEMARRWALVGDALEAGGHDALVVYGAGRFHLDIYWISDWPGGREAYALLPSRSSGLGEPALFVQFFNHVPLARRMAALEDVRWAGPTSIEALVEDLKRRGLGAGRARQVALAGKVPFQHYEALRAAFPDVRFVDFTRELMLLRTVKSEEEIARFRVAAQLTDRSLEALAGALRPGVLEWQLAAVLEAVYLEAGGYTGIHYLASMPMDRPNAYVPRQYLADRKIGEGDVVITEISGSYWGYTGQIHRTFSVRRPPNEAWRRLHEVAVEAYRRIESVLRDGATAEDVIAAADVIAEAGYTVCDDLFHGVDQLPPVLRTRQTQHQPYPRGFVFRENMLVTIQPNVMTPDGRMGLQFGETVRITKDGVERMHAYPRQWMVCG
ncbi:MAG: aminopeptidase P family protein [Firmicutes bacterium]|nr:aminopeptidase P family protein [Bacillota bacterium]